MPINNTIFNNFHLKYMQGQCLATSLALVKLHLPIFLFFAKPINIELSCTFCQDTCRSILDNFFL